MTQLSITRDQNRPANVKKVLTRPTQLISRSTPRWSENQIWPRAEAVDLGAILGGEATILGSVSRIEVREGTMGLPVMVVSQYRWFWRERVSRPVDQNV